LGDIKIHTLGKCLTHCSHEDRRGLEPMIRGGSSKDAGDLVIHGDTENIFQSLTSQVIDIFIALAHIGYSNLRPHFAFVDTLIFDVGCAGFVVIQRAVASALFNQTKCPEHIIIEVLEADSHDFLEINTSINRISNLP
jgi:hypothetical protein